MLAATGSGQNHLHLERSTAILYLHLQTKHRPPRHPEMHNRIPPQILEAIPLEQGTKWNDPKNQSYSETVAMLDKSYGPRNWRKLIAQKYELRRAESLLSLPGMTSSSASWVLRLEFPMPWAFTLARFKEENITVPEVHKWLRPACEIDTPLASFLKKYKSRFCTNSIFTLPPVEPNRYPTIFTVQHRWFYAGRLETYHSRHGKEPAMVVFNRAVQEAGR